jgi:hypothetical protein
MTVTATDIISADEVQAVLEERTEETYQFRRAYQEDDATDINSNSKTFPQAANDARDDMGDVAEEGTYPRSSLEYDGITAEYTKDGFEIAISDEAADDSVFDVILDITEQMSIAAESRLDQRAFVVIANNNNPVSIGSSGSDLNYAALVDAETQLFDDEYNPASALTFTSATAFGQLAKDSDLNRSTDDGDALARQGSLGDVFGVQVLRTNTGRLGATEAVMVDTNMYGYESTRWDREVDDYREEKNDRDVFKIRHRKDFLSTNPEAAVWIDGGVA